MKKLDLQKCIVGSVFTNCYFLKNKETGEMLIIDPGDNADRIEQKVLEMQGRPVAILLTHGHFDHILAAEEIKKKYNIPIYACAKEEKTLQDPRINLTSAVRHINDKRKFSRKSTIYYFTTFPTFVKCFQFKFMKSFYFFSR